MMIDFRSDILSGTRPAVIDAMVKAAALPPGFEAGEDRNERALQEEVSALFGFAAGLFVPTGTMANQIALRLWCQPGQSVLADAGSHLVTNEAPSTAGLNSVVVQAVDGVNGHLAPGQVVDALSAPEPFGARQLAAVWLENSHNRAGGTVMPGGWMADITEACRKKAMPVHVDGARIWNAALASDLALDAVARGASSLSVNLNKAIGAPVGCMLLGAEDFIAEANRVRRMMGGWWRPLGLLAAAGRAAIEGFEERLNADHRRAARLAAGFREAFQNEAAANAPQTNIVMFQAGEAMGNARICDLLAGEGILARPYSGNRIRFVLHSGIGDGYIERTIDAMAEIAGERLDLARP